MDKTNFIKVRSESDQTIVINVPELGIHRTFRKRGQEYPFERNALYQAYYDPSVEYLFTHGMVTTDDVDFKINFGLMEEEKDVVYVLTDAQKKRMIKLMPLAEVKRELAKMNDEQIEELVEYAITNYKDLNLDRIDVFSKVSGKDMMKCIDNYKKSLED